MSARINIPSFKSSLCETAAKQASGYEEGNFK